MQAGLFAQSTSFTYQGRLNENGNPANGAYDLHFTIYDALTNGVPLAATLTNNSVSIQAGAFTTLLDFGSAVFGGGQRWLEIAVRTNGAPAFTTLVPRQEFTRIPYAISALEVTGGNVARLAVPNTSKPASGRPIVTTGFITGATVVESGFGYVFPPAVTLQDATGTGAQIAATISGGSVTELVVVNAGTGYSPEAALVIDPPPRNEYQVFASTNIFAGVSVMTNVNNTVAGGFTGTFAGAHAGDFNGDGAAVTNVNAVTLQGISPGGFWRVDGNQGLSAERHFLGTTDDQAVELRVNNQRVVRYEPNPVSPSINSGSSANYIGNGVQGAVIAGGGTMNLQGLVLSNALRSPLTTISGGGGNSIAEGSPFASIGGGYDHQIESDSDGATISGGRGNVIRSSSIGAAIGGGQNNTITRNGDHSRIGGGFSNTIRDGADMGTISGGYGNVITADGAIGTIGGGYENTILTNSQFGTIPGGYQNSAGHSAFAAGSRAKAIHRGAFVWADSTGTEFASTDANQFIVRASGGVGIGTNNPATSLHVHGTDQTVAIVSGSRTTGTFLGIQNTAAGGARWSLVSTGPSNGEGAGRLVFFTHASNDAKMRLEPNGNLIIDGSLTQSSDRHRKEEVRPVDSESVLAKVTSMPISTWQYKDDEARLRHLGPMAQDFYEAFGLGEGDKTITAIDADGVALASIQALNKKLEQRTAEIEELKRTVSRLEALIESLPRELKGTAQ